MIANPLTEGSARAALAPQGETAGHVARALALLDAGDVAGARRELEQTLVALGAAGMTSAASPASQRSSQRSWPLFEAPPGPSADTVLGEFDDLSLDRAFEEAEVDPDEIHDAHRIAERTVVAVEAELDMQGPVLADADSPFATQTVAELLERQGHAEQARSVRQVISAREQEAGVQRSAGAGSASAAAAAAQGGGTGADRVIAALEGWLHNLGRGVA